MMKTWLIKINHQKFSHSIQECEDQYWEKELVEQEVFAMTYKSYLSYILFLLKTETWYSVDNWET